MPSPEELRRTLKRHFGYDSFRPLQAEIITDALAGRDVFALLPTGGGKSLCFQLPALIREGLTVVVSPLIALMKDQVDALTASGIEATFLNSTLGADEARARLRGLHAGKYRMLYAAPERLMLSGFLETLTGWNVAQIAIDEAHCISEWGHDFRPEYRQLAHLRSRFPGVPVMALTATATDRVRSDIVERLELAEPRCYVASFNRPNLFYRVEAKSQAPEQVLRFLRERREESGIIYCQSRKGVEALAERLGGSGIRALPYHAGLDSDVRARNQEAFLRDDARVICATIAFGMGINKPNVRFVIHYDLPKNIEGYYQETGRAGRDGLPSECLLLYSSGDVVKQTAFIDEKSDPEEQAHARGQLQQMTHFAEASGCRRAALLSYFSETLPGENCGTCDNCLTPPETWDGTVAAQKFLSCIIRLRQRSAFGVGLNHVVEVLTGADSEKLRRWGHEQVSTFGIGREHSRTAWRAIGRELVRLGLCRQTPEKFSTLEITEEGRAALRERRAVQLTRAAVQAEPERVRQRDKSSGAIPCDEELFQRLRTLRKTLAEKRDVPSYVIFSDAALRYIARQYPTEERAFAKIPGVGLKKLEDFGPEFMAAVREHLKTHPRQSFGPGNDVDDMITSGRGGEPLRRAATAFRAAIAAPPLRSAPEPGERSAPRTRRTPAPAPASREAGNGMDDSARQSYDLFRTGRSLDEVAALRGLTAGAVAGHLAIAAGTGCALDISRVLTAEEQARARDAFQSHGGPTLAPVFEALGSTISYAQLRIFRAWLQQPENS